MFFSISGYGCKTLNGTRVPLIIKKLRGTIDKALKFRGSIDDFLNYFFFCFKLKNKRKRKKVNDFGQFWTEKSRKDYGCKMLNKTRISLIIEKTWDIIDRV